jgi:NADPH:quinone reductase-like Zn-dependent oxidoreductase
LKIDPNIAPTDAAPLILSGMTAYQIFKYAAQLTSGQTFLVHGGSGAVGNILLQLCQLNGVKTVSTTSKSKLDMVSKLGATALDYNAVDYVQALKTASGAGFDAALDFSNQTSINQSFRLVKKGGKMVLCGLLTTQKQMEKKTLLNFLLFGFEFGGMMLKKAFWNRFSSKTVDFFGIVDSKRDFPERYQNDLNALCELVKNGQLKPAIHQVIPIDDVPKGHDLLEKGFVRGQIIVKMS